MSLQIVFLSILSFTADMMMNLLVDDEFLQSQRKLMQRGIAHGVCLFVGQ